MAVQTRATGLRSRSVIDGPGCTASPRRGAALLFQHRIIHTATEVTHGEKMVLRTDLVYGPAGFSGPLRMR